MGHCRQAIVGFRRFFGLPLIVIGRLSHVLSGPCRAQCGIWPAYALSPGCPREPSQGKKSMTISILDQMLFPLACGHEVVLGRMANLETWVYESCGKTTDLTVETFKSRLAQDLDTAMQIDAQEKAKGNPITRLA